MQYFSLSPVTRRMLSNAWPFLAGVALLVALALACMDIMSAARAFAGGASIWSKANKRALHCLTRYAETRSDSEYHCFQKAISVPLGDRKARVELDKEKTDLRVVTEGFIEGGNDPRDIPSGIRLYQRFRSFGHVSEAIAIWAAGDDDLLALVRIGQEMREQVHPREVDEARIARLLRQAHDIEERVTVRDDAFAAALGEASRQAQALLTLAILLAACALTGAGVVLARRVVAKDLHAEVALLYGTQRLQLAIAGSGHGIWDWSIVPDRLHVSPEFMETLGYRDWPADIGRTRFFALVHEEDRDRICRAFDDHSARGSVWDVEIRLQSATGPYRWARARGSVVRDAAGVPQRMAGAITDIDDLKDTEAQLYAEKERAQVTLESIGDAVITIDSGGRVEYMNPVAEVLTRRSAASARGLPIAAVCHFVEEATRKPLLDPFETPLSKEGPARLAADALLQREDGSEIAIDASAAPIRARDGTIIGLVLVLRDISKERAYAAQLSHQAVHDSLTGLINRGEFERRVAIALAGALEKRRHHAVMYLDLDQFKVVNDTCGHAAGDELLRQVSTLLQACLRQGDTLARLGGDEFGVLLENCLPADALRVADKLRQTVVDFRFLARDTSFPIGVSIGLVNLDDGAVDLTGVMSAADSACYLAKDNGRNRVQVHHPRDGELTLRRGMMQWVGRIHQAIEEGRLRLYAQPIAPMRDSRGPERHVELLLRMVERDGQLVPPMAFLPAAERYNLMPAIDRWVVRAAFETLAGAREPWRGTCAINLSGATICDERFLDYVCEQYRRLGIEPSTICFEITETVVIANLAKASRFIDELRRLGFRFSLDDFGSGMSSFAYLKQLPVDFLKIDGAFVKDMLDDPIDRAMVEAINHIGHVMGMQTIAEYVENERILVELHGIGVDYAQGYGIARPMPFELLCAAGPLPAANAGAFLVSGTAA